MIKLKAIQRVLDYANAVFGMHFRADTVKCGIALKCDDKVLAVEPTDVIEEIAYCLYFVAKHIEQTAAAEQHAKE